MHYVHTDHLGSLNVITNQNGAIEQELSFDAWGRRRNPDTWANITGTPAGLLTRRENRFSNGLVDARNQIHFVNNKDQSVVLLNVPDKVYYQFLKKFVMVNNQLNNSFMKRLMYAVLIVAIIAIIIMIKPNFKTYAECRYFRSEEFTEIKSFILRSTQEFGYHFYREPLNLSEVISYIQTSDPQRAEGIKNIQNKYSLELIKDSAWQKIDLISVVSIKNKEKVPLEEFTLFNCVFSKKNIILGSEPLKDYICNREDPHILLLAESNSELSHDSIAKDFKGCISKFLKRHFKTDVNYTLDKNNPKRYVLHGWKNNNLIKCEVLCNYTMEEIESVRIFEDSMSLILTPKIINYNLKEVYLPFALFDIYKEGKLMYSASFNIIGFNGNY